MLRDSILIVDDTPVNLKLTRILLSGEGYEVRTAQDAAEALEILETFRPNLILVDIQLPGMDGLELTRRLRRKSEMNGVIIVALTAYAMRGDEQSALQAGCDGYITKPINTREFPEAVRNYLARGKRASASPPKPPHDLSLAALGRQFAADGARQCQQLLDSLEEQFDRAGAARVLHQWIGAGGVLGHPAISQMAQQVEQTLRQDGPAAASQLRAGLTQIRNAFSAAIAREPEASEDPDLAERITK